MYSGRFLKGYHFRYWALNRAVFLCKISIFDWRYGGGCGNDVYHTMMTSKGRRRPNIVALLLAVAVISVGGRPHNLNNKQNFNNNNNIALTKSLLQRAHPYRPKNNNDINSSAATQYKQQQPTQRKLDDNVEITSSHTLKFSQCIDLQLLDKDLFDENVIDFTMNGQIMSTKSFALFHVCDNVSYDFVCMLCGVLLCVFVHILCVFSLFVCVF